MRTDRDISRRVREMLTQDKLLVSDGFLAALKSDLGRLLGGYFRLSSQVSVTIDREPSGAYAVHISFAASDLMRFDTTLDIKRY